MLKRMELERPYTYGRLSDQIISDAKNPVPCYTYFMQQRISQRIQYFSISFCIERQGQSQTIGIYKPN